MKHTPGGYLDGQETGDLGQCQHGIGLCQRPVAIGGTSRDTGVGQPQ
jgi:hypothetical protein